MVDPSAVDVERFTDGLPSSVRIKIGISLSGTLPSVCEQLSSILDVTIQKYTLRNSRLLLYVHSNSVPNRIKGESETLLVVSVRDETLKFFDENYKVPHSIAMYIISDMETAQVFYNKLLPIKTNPPATIRWFYLSNGAIDSKGVDLYREGKIYDEHYPFLGKSLEEFYQGFLEDSANVLFLYGQPGTGKTTFIREYLISYAHNAAITYDSRVLQSDELYIRYIVGDYDVLVIEDADSLLLDRAKSGNETMSKILNAADGLIRGKSKKKFIFTTNLPTLRDVDPALLRLGRCYDVISFRELTTKEAVNAAEVAGLNFIPKEGRKNYTLAEIFNQKEDSSKVGNSSTDYDERYFTERPGFL
jgi:hypothetical protein